jgi:hypothetical protein
MHFFDRQGRLPFFPQGEQQAFLSAAATPGARSGPWQGLALYKVPDVCGVGPHLAADRPSRNGHRLRERAKAPLGHLSCRASAA